MAPNYKQMNTAQRSSRKALIGQVSNLLVKRKNAGTGDKMPKPVAFGQKQVAMRPLGTVIPGTSKRGKRIRQAHKLGPRIAPFLGGGDTGA